MMTVFLSYRHENDAHRTRVRMLAEQLRAAGINVVLDQFFLDVNPGGPNEGWSTWSKRQAADTEKHVLDEVFAQLIIASPGCFRCYDRIEVSGSGLGAAAESGIIAQRLYNQAGSNPIARLVVFESANMQGVPLDLQSYHRFDPARDFATSFVGSRVYRYRRLCRASLPIGQQPRRCWIGSLPTATSARCVHAAAYG